MSAHPLLSPFIESQLPKARDLEISGGVDPLGTEDVVLESRASSRENVLILFHGRRLREEGTYFRLLRAGLFACIALGNGMTACTCVMVDSIKHHFISYLRKKQLLNLHTNNEAGQLPLGTFSVPGIRLPLTYRNDA